MATVIGSNINSLKAQRLLNKSSEQLASTFERLSSGLRINRASDDAAGLAISSSLKTSSRVYTQGIRNINDGLSVLNVADGALSQLSNIVIRINELAEQAANGPLGVAQRESLNEEAQSLADEYFRIAKSTEFQDRKLFEGDYGILRLQAGYGLDGSVGSDLGGAIGDGTFAAGVSSTSGAQLRGAEAIDLNGDGHLDIASASRTGSAVYVQLGNGDGTFQTAQSFAVGAGPKSITASDFNGDGIIDLATGNDTDATVSVLIGNGDGTYATSVSYGSGFDPLSIQAGDLNGDGYQDLVSVDAKAGEDSISILFGIGDGTFADEVSIDVEDDLEPNHLEIGDMNNDGILDLVITGIDSHNSNTLLGNGDGTFQSELLLDLGSNASDIALGDVNGDGNLDMLTTHNSTLQVSLGNGDGTYQGPVAYGTSGSAGQIKLSDFNGDGILDASIGTAGPTVNILLGNGDGSFQTATSYAGTGAGAHDVGDFDGDGVADIITADNGTTSVLLANTDAGVAPLLEMDLSTLHGARQAIPLLQRKIEQLALQRGTIGAFQSRLEAAAKALEGTSQNYIAANSHIEDADIATESSNMVRLQILRESAAAVLAQANQQGLIVKDLIV